MDSWIGWNKKFVRLAQKISAEKHLVAVRDSFISILPITMVGSVAVLLNVFLGIYLIMQVWQVYLEAMQPLIQINGLTWFCITLYLIFSFHSCFRI